MKSSRLTMVAGAPAARSIPVRCIAAASCNTPAAKFPSPTDFANLMSPSTSAKGAALPTQPQTMRFEVDAIGRWAYVIVQRDI
jgi:hypothetical protein